MKKELKTSVIIPAYNAEKTISGTLRSLLAQTARDFEILIVDDGSTDKTPDICHRFKEESSVVIRVFSQHNKRQSAARNFGIKKAEGKYVIFLDADDLAEKKYVEKLVHAADRDPEVDISCCSYSLLYQDGSSKLKKLPSNSERQTLFGREALIQLLKETLEVWSGSALYRREFILQNDIFYDEKMTMGQDIDFRWRAFFHARKVALIPDLLVHYVQHDLSVTRAFDPVRYPPSTWLDPSLFLEYIENNKSEDGWLKSVVQDRVIPRFLIRRLRNFILYGLEKLFWLTVDMKETRAILKRGFYKNLLSSPAVGLKCFSLLIMPELLYRRY